MRYKKSLLKTTLIKILIPQLEKVLMKLINWDDYPAASLFDN